MTTQPKNNHAQTIETYEHLRVISTDVAVLSKEIDDIPLFDGPEYRASLQAMKAASDRISQQCAKLLEDKP